MDTAVTRAGTLSSAFTAAEASSAGLSSGEAQRRLRRFGRNVLHRESGTHPLALVFNQFRSPLIIILLAAAGLTFALGEVNEAIIIAVIVVASSGLGFYQEFMASRAVEALRARLAVNAMVLRDGSLTSMPASEVVPGDVVTLAAGSLVPADGILIEAQDIEVDEAALTGESFPASKLAAASAPLTDDNRVHMGTSVRSGLGRALIVATGAATQFGSIAHDIAGHEPETSFAKGIRSFGILMTQIMLVMVALVLPINVVLGRPLLESLLFSAALAVGLTPELLPAIVSVTLARGAQQLAKAGVLVRRLVAIENLGAMEILCTDKTGTLTEGVVKLDRACDVAGKPSAEALGWGALNAQLQTGMPNPLDQAIIAAADQIEAIDYEKLDEVPYDFERKRLSVLARGPASTILICKGSVMSVLPLCTDVLHGGEVKPLTQAARAEQEHRFAEWSRAGFRVLAIATRQMDRKTQCERADESSLTLVGYLLFSDPPKPEVGGMIADLARRGVRLKIVTGDNRHVAAHVAEQVGLASKHVLTGAEISKLGHRALARRAIATSVFAEVTPDQKERIIVALRSSHHVVGYLGDGINDAPPLRAADIGISVDTAVDAAKEAADVVLLRQDLGVLLEGIVIGRTAFANTQKYIAITTSANIGNMISMAAASLFLPFLPLLAKQILLNNLMSDLPLLSISTDKVDPEVIDRPGRWDFPGLLRSMLAFGAVSSIFDGLTFVVLLLAFHASEVEFQTGWFTVSLLTEIAVVGVMRTRKPFHTSAPSTLLIVVSIVVAGLGIALPYIGPVAAAVALEPLPPSLLAGIIAIVIAYVVATEALKRIIWSPRQRRVVNHRG